MEPELSTGPPSVAAGALHTVLVTGVGGAGRTTVAAATALVSARNGARTLLIGAGTDRELEAVLGFRPGRTGTTGHGGEDHGSGTVPGLWTARPDAGAELRARAAALQDRGRAVLELLGTDPLDDGELEGLTGLPGADAFALLHALREAHTAGCWDTVVVDMPPVPDALETLALPEVLRRCLRRLFPQERQAARGLRPVMAQLAGVPVPAQTLYGTAARWERQLADVQRAVASPGTTVRLVAEPGPRAAEALRTARYGLALHGLRLGGVVANRLLPAGSRDTWTAALSGQQQAALGELREVCRAGGVPLHELPHLGHDPRGTGDLDALAAGDVTGPSASVPDTVVDDDREVTGLLVWRLPLPGARQEEVGLVRRGDELTVSCGQYRRTLQLPSALRRCRGAGAALEDGELRVRFSPDPDLWPGPVPSTPGTEDTGGR